MATSTRSKPARSPKRKAKSRKKSQPKLSRTRKPDGMPLDAWQLELRKQFGRDQDFGLENVGGEPIFSEFHVTNPKTQSTYRVAIRGVNPGDNYCSCGDFATNMLGTCKHVEFTLAKLERKRGGKTALRNGFQPAYSEVFLQYGPQRSVRFRPGTDCPAELARLASKYFDDEQILGEKSFARFHTFLSKASKIDHDLRCYEDTLGFIAQVRDDENRRKRLAKAFPSGARSAAFKQLLKVPLYDYQKEGALFAARAGRCLLGDEMGLGKTIQALGAAEIMARELGVERVLIVCPTSLKHQWEREISKFTARSAHVIGGPRPLREKQFREEDGFFKITNYDTVHRDLDLIEELSPDLVILDEAQRIKNWETRAARNVKKIDSPYCVVLTGTPLENRLEELFSIVEFIDRHRLGPTYRFLHDHQLRDENGRVVGYRDLDRIGKTLEPVLLRRQKDQVLDQLPKRLEKNFFVPMTPQQTEHHEENKDSVARVVHKWRRYGFLTEADQRRLMICLQNMRMSCNSTYLLDHETDFSVKPDELATLLDELFERPDSKAIIFSQWVRMHELSIRRFTDRPWDHVFFHGGVPSNKRKQLVDQFREDPTCRAFLATDAGGVGLNLQNANIVINMDLPWNPAILEQRIGRAHRLGQKQPVQVVNFVSEGTIEEGMLSVLAFKKSLFAGVLDGGEKEVFLGSSRLKRFIDTVEKVTKEIPETPVVVQEQADSRSESPAQEPTAESTPMAAPDSQSPAPIVDPLAGLLQNGLQLLEQLAAVASTPASGGSGRTGNGNGTALPFATGQDKATGQSYLKVPLPSSDMLQQTLQAVATLLENVRR